MLYIFKIPTKFGVVFPKIFVKIKILTRIRIRILLWISIPELKFIQRSDPPNFIWILQNLLCSQNKNLGITRMSSDADFGMNRNKSDWFGMNLNPNLLRGEKVKKYIIISKRQNSLLFQCFNTYQTKN